MEMRLATGTLEFKDNKDYFENLDGLRFISAVSVLLFHNYNNFQWKYFESNQLFYRICSFISRNGLKAVNFFFVLSGFLITYLICKEIDRRNNFNYNYFIMRRIFRIWPLFFLVVILGFIISQNWSRFYLYLTFINNIDAVFHQENLNAFLFPLWSIAVEEQFYIIIPLVIYILKIRSLNGFLTLFLSLLIISIVYQIYNRNNLNKLHYGTLSCLTDVSIGAIAGALSYFSLRFRNYFSQISKKNILLIYFFGIAYLVNLVYINNEFLKAMERLILALFFCFIILEQNFSIKSFFKISNYKFISNSGKYTYSLYLTHMFVFSGVHFIFERFPNIDNYTMDIFGKLVISLLLSYLLSMYLYKVIEQPILKLKERLH